MSKPNPKPNTTTTTDHTSTPLPSTSTHKPTPVLTNPSPYEAWYLNASPDEIMGFCTPAEARAMNEANAKKASGPKCNTTEKNEEDMENLRIWGDDGRTRGNGYQNGNRGGNRYQNGHRGGYQNRHGYMHGHGSGYQNGYTNGNGGGFAPPRYRNGWGGNPVRNQRGYGYTHASQRPERYAAQNGFGGEMTHWYSANEVNYPGAQVMGYRGPGAFVSHPRVLFQQGYWQGGAGRQ